MKLILLICITVSLLANPNMWGKLILLICLIVTLTGCAEYQLYKTTIKHAGAQIADEALAAKLWSLCYPSTFGAIRRRFGDSPEQARALYTICKDVEKVNLLIPDEP